MCFNNFLRFHFSQQDQPPAYQQQYQQPPPPQYQQHAPPNVNPGQYQPQQQQHHQQVPVQNVDQYGNAIPQQQQVWRRRLFLSRRIKTNFSSIFSLFKCQSLVTSHINSLINSRKRDIVDNNKQDMVVADTITVITEDSSKFCTPETFVRRQSELIKLFIIWSLIIFDDYF